MTRKYCLEGSFLFLKENVRWESQALSTLPIIRSVASYTAATIAHTAAIAPKNAAKGPPNAPATALIRPSIPIPKAPQKPLSRMGREIVMSKCVALSLGFSTNRHLCSRWRSLDRTCPCTSLESADRCAGILEERWKPTAGRGPIELGRWRILRSVQHARASLAWPRQRSTLWPTFSCNPGRVQHC